MLTHHWEQLEARYRLHALVDEARRLNEAAEALLTKLNGTVSSKSSVGSLSSCSTNSRSSSGRIKKHEKTLTARRFKKWASKKHGGIGYSMSLFRGGLGASVLLSISPFFLGLRRRAIAKNRMMKRVLLLEQQQRQKDLKEGIKEGKEEKEEKEKKEEEGELVLRSDDKTMPSLHEMNLTESPALLAAAPLPPMMVTTPSAPPPVIATTAFAPASGAAPPYADTSKDRIKEAAVERKEEGEEGKGIEVNSVAVPIGGGPEDELPIDVEHSNENVDDSSSTNSGGSSSSSITSSSTQEGGVNISAAGPGSSSGEGRGEDGGEGEGEKGAALSSMGE